MSTEEQTRIGTADRRTPAVALGPGGWSSSPVAAERTCDERRRRDQDRSGPRRRRHSPLALDGYAEGGSPGTTNRDRAGRARTPNGTRYRDR
ncbi:hypothetical protein [Streptomyces sp. KL116D]|uniref:hypothetical protein n=1 Tax=Streptomyces sp. KL116D TaxID=3045152 RepID=UPI003555D2E3